MSVADQGGLIGDADEANAGTLEFEFTPDELLMATRAAALQQKLPLRSIEFPTSSPPTTPPAARDRLRTGAAHDPNGFWVQIAAVLALAVADLGGVWELSSGSQRPIPTTAVTAEVLIPAVKPSPLLPAAAERPVVRFTNPFDASEVFEFPPETSMTQAHDAVADLLLQRARDRRQLIAKMKGVSRAGIHMPRAVTAQNPPRPHG